MVRTMATSAILFAALLSTAAQAVTVHFTAMINHVGQESAPYFALGDQLKGEFNYDSTVHSSRVNGVNTYFDALKSISLEFARGGAPTYGFRFFYNNASIEVFRPDPKVATYIGFNTTPQSYPAGQTTSFPIPVESARAMVQFGNGLCCNQGAPFASDTIPENLDFSKFATYHLVDLLFSSGNRNFLVEADIDLASVGIPEPATWTMVIGGFGFAGAAARRRAQRTATYT